MKFVKLQLSLYMVLTTGMFKKESLSWRPSKLLETLLFFTQKAKIVVITKFQSLYFETALETVGDTLKTWQ